MSDKAGHWEGVYARKRPDEVSWYRAHLERSMGFVEKAGLPRSAGIIDVGGGASTFVDDLLGRGYSDVTVLDISSASLEAAKQRLGTRAQSVRWLIGDITEIELPERSYDFWHDRAVFHFLCDPVDRKRYVAAVLRALKPGGHLAIATFGPNGPQKCSGLDVVRYSADQLQAEFGSRFLKLESQTELHATPGGSEQEFVYCHWKLKA
jgi:ubiquinone/menaquinone biosynthesis C-methylase UbiE